MPCPLALGIPPSLRQTSLFENSGGPADPSQEFKANDPLNLGPLLPSFQAHGHEVPGLGEKSGVAKGGCQPVLHRVGADPCAPSNPPQKG